MTKKTVNTLSSFADPLGQPLSKKEAYEMLKRTDFAFDDFLSLHNKEFQEELIRYFMGEGSVQVTYDSIFKHLFHPEKHPERLSRLISELIGTPVTVKRALLTQSDRISEKGSLLIMDILVELLSGELANVEMQRIGYHFPGQRGACYSSDLILRQYSDVRNREGDTFSYKHLHPVYTIVLIGDSPHEFLNLPHHYIHRSKQIFDTGLELELLQKFVFISLDNFKKITQNEPIETELQAWLHFLSATDIPTIQKIVKAYPAFLEMYEDLARFRLQPKEMIRMYSDALKTLDYNTVQYMIEEQKKEIEAQAEMLKQKDDILKKQQKEIEALKKLVT